MRHLVVILAVGLAYVPVPALADAGADARVEAKQHYDAGETAFRLGELDRAITEWRQSYELSKVPLLLYDIGQAYRQKGDKKQALFFYQQYLSVAPTGENHDVAEKRVDELKQALAAEQKAQTAPPQGPTPPGANSTPTEAAPTPSHAQSSATTMRAPAQRSRLALALGWCGVGVGIAAAAVSAGLLGAAASERNDALTAPTQTTFDMHHENSLRLQQGGWPLLGVGAVLAVAGTVVLVLNAKKGHER